MQELNFKDFSQGWCPSDDAIQGRKNCLIRMDNLQLDENGIISLVRGTQDISADLGAPVNNVYSKIFNGSKHRYASYGGSVVKSIAGGPFGLGVLLGGDPNWTAFGTALNSNLICSGTVKKKDDGAFIRDLGIPKASTPTTAVVAVPIAVLSCMNLNAGLCTNWILIENGTVFTNNTGDFVAIDVNPNTLRSSTQTPALGAALTLNTMLYADGTPGNDDDIFSMRICFGASEAMQNVRVDFFLKTVTATNSAAEHSDYYWASWTADATAQPRPDNQNIFSPAFTGVSGDIPHGFSAWSTLTIKRSDFTRVGSDTSLDWSAIKGVRVTVSGLAVTSYTIRDLGFTSSIRQPLNGTVSYIQVDMYDNGSYVAKSPASDPTANTNAINSRITITPSTPAGWAVGNCNRIWIYRYGGNLQDYLKVYEINRSSPAAPAAFDDVVKDEDAILENEVLQRNLVLPPDGIIGIVGNFFDRTLYLTSDSLWPSLQLCPDTCRNDDRQQISGFSGAQAEICLWIEKVALGVVLIGTTYDIYEITGTMNEDTVSNSLLGTSVPGVLDVTVKPLGVKHPPVSKAHATDSGILFYMAADGWRSLYGSETQLVSANTDLLFKGYQRHLVGPILLPAADNSIAAAGISKGKLFCSMLDATLGRVVHVYDFLRKYWYLYRSTASPLCFFMEEDSTLISGDEDGTVKILDVGQSLFDFKMVSTFNDADRSNNRKDGYTLKVIFDSGNNPVNIYARGYKDDGSIYQYSSTIAFNGREEKQFQIYDVLGPVKSFEIEVSGNSDVARFYNANIVYDLRPDQTLYTRIPPNNLGVTAKKRIRTVPFVIDTLGSPATITLSVDGVPYPPMTFTTNFKQTVFYYFTTDVFGVDIEGNIRSDKVHEFYEIPQPTIVETLPTPKMFDQLGPIEFARNGKVKMIRLALLPFGADLNTKIYAQDILLYNVNIVLVANKESSYEIPIPKGINPTLCRVELLSSQPFHRLKAQFKVELTGMQTQNRWVDIK